MKRLVVLLLLCAPPAFAQYLTPASGVQLRLEAQFTGSCSTTNPPVGIARDTGNQFCCTAGSWVQCGATATPGASQAFEHASLYGDPGYYLRPALYDQYWDVFMGHPLSADYNGDGTPGDPNNATDKWIGLTQCAANSCVTDLGYFCTNGTAATSFAVGDVVYAATGTWSPTGDRAHVISAIGNGTGADCPAGTNNKVSVFPLVDQNNEIDLNGDNTVDTQVGMVSMWRNDTHYTRAGAALVGKRIGYASRLIYGAQGPNLLVNGEADITGTAATNWSVSTGALAANGFTNTPQNGTPSFKCTEGTSASAACFFFNTSTNGAYIQATRPIQVTPGDTYVLSGTGMFKSGDSVGLAADTTNDGTIEAAYPTGLSYTINGTLQANHYDGWMNYWWASFQIPELVHEVYPRITRGTTTASYPQLDAMALRRVTTYTNDSVTDLLTSASHTTFLINDPGTRNIVITGDSWAAPTSLGDNVKVGLAAALNARFGRDITSQILVTGVGGYTTANVVTNFNTLIAANNPLYAIIFVSTNDIVGGVALATSLANIETIATKCRQAGVIPIFVSPAPLGPTGTATLTAAHTFADAERRALLNVTP